MVALPGRKFTGTVKEIGGTTGPPWDRRFECRIGVDNASQELRPGMSVRMVITTQVMKGVLWVPSQALFESDGRKFVYVRQTANGFMPRDVKLVRRSESQVVIEGLGENGTGRAGESGSDAQQTGAAEGQRSFRRYSDDLLPTSGRPLRNLRAQKTRTLLTALGIVFGVGSVIGMLAIGAGAREESLRFIEQLGVRNVLIDSRPATSQEELQQRRRSSPGLTERDVRILEANIESLETLSPRRRLHPARVLPKPSQATCRSCTACARRTRPSTTCAGGGPILLTDEETAQRRRSACSGETAKVELAGLRCRRWASTSR